MTDPASDLQDQNWWASLSCSLDSPGRSQLAAALLAELQKTANKSRLAGLALALGGVIQTLPRDSAKALSLSAAPSIADAFEPSSLTDPAQRKFAAALPLFLKPLDPPKAGGSHAQPSPSVAKKTSSKPVEKSTALSVTDRLSQKLISSLQLIPKTANPDSLTPSIRVMAPYMSPADTAKVLSLLRVFLQEQRLDSYSAHDPLKTIAALAARMQSKDASSTLRFFAKIAPDSPPDIPRLDYVFSDTIKTCAHQLNKDDAALIQDDFSDQLIKIGPTNQYRFNIFLPLIFTPPVPTTPTNLFRFATLARILETIVTQTNVARSPSLLRASLAISNAVATTTNFVSIARLCEIAGRLDPKAGPAIARPYAAKFISALESDSKASSSKKTAPSDAILPFLDQVASDDELFIRGFRALAAAIEQAGRNNPQSLGRLGWSMHLLAYRASGAESTNLIRRAFNVLLPALQQHSMDDDSYQQGSTVATLATMLGPDEMRLATRALTKELLAGDSRDLNHLNALAGAFITLAPDLPRSYASSAARDLADAIWDVPSADKLRLNAIALSLDALADQLDPAEAADVASQAAAVLINSSEEAPDEVAAADNDDLGDINRTLLQLSLRVPNAPDLQRVALSCFLFSPRYWDRPAADFTPLDPDDRKLVSAVCDGLQSADLVDLLKWPCSLGEAQNLILAGLSAKLKRDFQSDIWQFAYQVSSGGLTGFDLDSPVERPRAKLSSRPHEYPRNQTNQRVLKK